MNAAASVSGSDSPFAAAIGWIDGLLLGSLAVGLCVIAVATVGLMMFTGHLPVRRGMQVVLGCFILLGAPVIAAGFSAMWTEAGGVSGPPPPPYVEPIRAAPPPADYDPYAGASMRRE